jgi:branched-chain amino acid aminotransferase
VKRTGAEWTQSGGEPGEVTLRLREALLDIQRGDTADQHGWMHKLG